MIDKSILARHNKSVTDIVRFLDSGHLPPELRHIPILFETLAAHLLADIPSSPFLTVTIRRLVDAKNEAVAAHIHAQENHLRHLSYPEEQRSDTVTKPTATDDGHTHVL